MSERTQLIALTSLIIAVALKLSFNLLLDKLLVSGFLAMILFSVLNY